MIEGMTAELRLATLALAVATLLAACGGDADPSVDEGNGTTTTTTIETQDDEVETGDSADIEDDGDDADASDADDDGDGLDDPDDDTLGTSPDIEEMVDAANEDGTVTSEEMAEILVESGTPETQASCEGRILAELGVTDPTDPEQLQAVAADLTEEQRAALSNCIAAG